MYLILSELKLRRFFAAVYFINTNPPEERVQVLLSDKELNELPDNSPKFFKKSNIDHYMGRPSAAFCYGKYSIFDDLLLRRIFSILRTWNQVRPANISQMSWMIIWLRTAMKSVLTPQKIELMISEQTMHCRKIRRILRCLVLNKLLSPEK